MTQNNLAGKAGIEATHSGGRGEIFHDWFPYLEGFSPTFVNNLLEKYLPNAKLILEPFAGTGTTPLSLAQRGISTVYCELNPSLRGLIDAKQNILCGIHNKKILAELEVCRESLKGLLKSNREDKTLKATYVSAFGDSVYFTESNFKKILKLKTIERQLSTETQPYFSIAVFSSLLEASLLKRAGDVRFKTEKELAKGTPDVEDILESKLNLMCSDIQSMNSRSTANIKLLANDSKSLSFAKLVLADGVITSPPYLNGTNYFRNTKLELWYSEHLNSKEDLRKLRNLAITAGINDVEKNSGAVVLPEIRKVHQQITEVCYDKRIPKMIAAYFTDMKLVFEGLQKNVKKDGVICVDIGDSLYSNVHIPTHTILLKLGKSIGWTKVDEIILRERYSNNGTKLSQRLLVFKNG